MTSLLRMKRQITVREPNTLLRTTINAAVGLMLVGWSVSQPAIGLAQNTLPYAHPGVNHGYPSRPTQQTSPWPRLHSQPPPPPTAIPRAPVPFPGPAPVQRAYTPPQPRQMARPQPSAGRSRVHRAPRFTIRQTSYQQPLNKQDDELRRSFLDQLTFGVPGKNRLFRLESDPALYERIRQEYRSRNQHDNVQFPEDVVLSNEVYQGRAWKRKVEFVEPNYVCYNRPYFEQINYERYGWELGVFQPIISTGKFYWDVFWLPYNLGTEPFRHYECNAGYCLPGDPVPLYLYPPQLSVTGAASQAAALTGAAVLFP